MLQATYTHTATSKTNAFNYISREDFDALDLDPSIKERVLIELANWTDCFLHIEDGVVTHCSSSIMLTNEKPKWNVRYCYSFRRRDILNTREREQEARKIADEYWEKEAAKARAKREAMFA